MNSLEHHHVVLSFHGVANDIVASRQYHRSHPHRRFERDFVHIANPHTVWSSNGNCGERQHAQENTQYFQRNA